MPEDPQSSHELARKGQLAFDFGEFWTKGLRMATGQTNVKSYNRQLCRMIESGKVRPSFVVSHRLSLEEAPEAYQHFDARENGWTKVVLRPNEAKPALRGVPAARRTQNKGQHESHRQARH
jgi:glutathione-independent formaldehyde dehydrogenase